MSILKAIEAGSGFLKASIFGDAGSGKTTLAVMLALTTRKHFGLKGPIVFVDTENGSPWVSEWVQRETGVPMIGVKTRSFDDLISAVSEAVTIPGSVAVVDSATHFWQELNTTFLKRINDSRKSNRMQTLDKLEFQHMNAIKEKWGTWTSLFLNSPIHVVTCGRLQNEWEMETNEKGKKELIKVGVRFQAERQFGHEASILVEMESEQVLDGSRVVNVIHRATVLKDRNPDPATSLVGKTCDQPTGDFFLPHLSLLRPASHSPVSGNETRIDVDEAGRSDFQRELRMREIVMEELAAELDKSSLSGTAGEAKAKRARLLEECFGTASKTALEGMKSGTLREGLAKVRVRLGELKETA